MNDQLSDDNIATRKGSSAFEVRFRVQLPATEVCQAVFLDELATVIVASVGRTQKRLLRLYCAQSVVKVQILSTYIPVRNLRSNEDVALELQRQLGYASSPFRSNVSAVDPSFHPPPIEVINCSDTSLLFEQSCTKQSQIVQPTWLGLEANNSSTIAIFAVAGVLVCLLFAIFVLCLRRFLKSRARVQDKAKWIVAVQQEQAQELEVARSKPPSGESTAESSGHDLLPRTIAIPFLPVEACASPSPAPHSIPPLQDSDFNLCQDYDDDVYMETPPSEVASRDEVVEAFGMEEYYDEVVLAQECQPINRISELPPG